MMKRNQITKEIFLERSHSKYGNKYDYANMNYVSYRKPVNIICPTHGEFTQTPLMHLLSKHGCKKCGHDKINETRQLTTQQFIDRSNKIHNNKYSYVNTNYINFMTKVKIDCPIHGEFTQEPNNHLKGSGCNKCGSERTTEKISVTVDNFIQDAKLLHNDIYDYSIITNVTPLISTRIPIICKTHGVFYQIAHNHINGGGCPKCSHNGTSKGEDILKNYFICNNIRYVSNTYTILDKKELDFYLPDYNIAIELNGLYWHSELKGKGKMHHINKTNLCRDKGIRLIHYTDFQLHRQWNIVKHQLDSTLNISKRPIYGRKCVIKEIDTKVKSKFLKKYHLQGNDKASVKLGLFYNTKLVSVMTFCKRRVALGSKESKEGEYELSRYCGIFNFYVIGGASKLLKHFERNYNPSKIVTYADKSRSNGDMYFKLGFTHTHDSPPNYWYFKSHYLKDKLYHRFNFRKSELSKKLDVFDPTLNEWDNMKNDGWNRYWDCGNMVFEKCYVTSQI